MTEPAAARPTPLMQPQGAHTVAPDVRAQMAEALRSGQVPPAAAPPGGSAAPAVPPAGAAPSPPLPPSAAPDYAQQAQQALADVVPLFKLPGTPEGSLAPQADPDPVAGDEGSVSGDASTPDTTLPVERLQQIDQWVTGLSPRELLILDGAMSGDIDARLAAELIAGTPPPAAVPAAPAVPAPEPDLFDPNQFADPDLAAYTKQRLDALEQRARQAEDLSRAAIEADRAQLQRQHQEAIAAAAGRFGTKYNLDETAVLKVANLADQLGLIGGLLSSAGNVPLDSVYERALELGFRADDTLYAQHVETLAAERAKELARVAREQDEKSRTRAMKDNASTVTNIASRDLPKTPEPVDPRMLNDEQRIQAIAHLVKQARGR